MKNTHHKNQNKNIHDPVLLEAVLKYLEAQPGESIWMLQLGMEVMPKQ
jgi:hypothetical protein